MRIPRFLVAYLEFQFTVPSAKLVAHLSVPSELLGRTRTIPVGVKQVYPGQAMTVAGNKVAQVTATDQSISVLLTLIIPHLTPRSKECSTI